MSNSRLASRLDFCAVPGRSVPRAMIKPDEFAMLASAAKHIWELGAHRDGAIVDAGSFIGASTLGLAEGLSQSPLNEAERQGRIWSYDLFKAIPAIAEKSLAGEGLKTGDSFRYIYDDLTKDYSRYIQTYEGDIVTAPKPQGQIAILFLDVLWNWDAARSLAEDFYPGLATDRSILIHQDFVYPFYPWIILSMGLLKETFPFAKHVDASSVVFDVAKPYGAGSLDDYRNIPTATALRFYDEFIDRLEGWAKGSVGLGKALFIAERGDLDRAAVLVDRIEESFTDVRRVTQYLPNIRNHLKKAMEGRAAPLGKDAVKVASV